MDVERTRLARVAALAIARATLSQLHGEALIERALLEPSTWPVVRSLHHAIEAGRTVYLFGAGKAACAMALGLERAWGPRLSRGLVVTTAAGLLPLSRTDVLVGGHPVPTEASLLAGEALLHRAAQLKADDVCIFLLSGGASACAEALKPSVSLDALALQTQGWLQSGLPIQDINRGRQQLSRLKAGGFARATKARVFTCVLSDIVGVDGPTSEGIELVGGGPTIAEPPARESAEYTSGHVMVLASPRTLAAAAVAEASAFGYTLSYGGELVGEAKDLGQALARRPALGVNEGLAYYGESTVTIDSKHAAGSGGRNQELALAFAQAAAGSSSVLLALASDGVDGTTAAAGALVDGATVARGQAAHLDCSEALSRHDSFSYLSRCGATVYMGKTGTNLADLTLVLGAFRPHAATP